ncbi:acidic phospholipase A2 E-like [Orbicella faveolata]|uniref:acidic phospholipase A2 E-like n=1 Tax=Orbicella faveolata TaxID=48498 RepID=UPI0009E29E42|nr:acidic phospholipase A2 E-like [Orbicella faveolata]
MKASAVMTCFSMVLISAVFCYSPELEKRIWQPASWFEPLIKCKTGNKHSLGSYGCYCGPAFDKQFKKTPVDDLDRCCLQHKKCLEKYTTEGEDSLCSPTHLRDCEWNAINCMYALDIKKILRDGRNNLSC